MRHLADFFYALAAFAYFPVVLYQAVFLGKNRSGWAQRLGFLSHLEPCQRPVWVHAVSLGEVNAATELIKALRTQKPEQTIIISSTTDTGYRRAVQLHGEKRVFRFPLDFSLVVSRVLGTLEPRLIVLVELEVWPNLVGQAAARNIPIVVVNGRLTDRSARRLSYLGRPMNSVFSRLTWVGAQDEVIAQRFRSLGVQHDRVTVTGSMKWDGAVIVDQVPGSDGIARALGLMTGRPIWVCGSTGPGEEEILLAAYQSLNKCDQTRPVLIIIPRKPERFDEVARLIESRSFKCIRRTLHPSGSLPAQSSGDFVILGDTMGELRSFYSLADLVFVGRSLVPMGGSDPMEAAALAKPIICGPHYSNFEQPVRVLHDAGALLVVSSAAELAHEVSRMIRNAPLRLEMGRKGRAAVLENRGATEKTIHRLLALLETAPASLLTPPDLGISPVPYYNHPPLEHGHQARSAI